MSTSQPHESSAAAPGLARSATLLSLGNIASRVFGLAREIVIAGLFGASGEVSAFRIAAQVPTLLYDFLIGGMLSAALVPVLSDYAHRERGSFVRLVQTLASLFALGLAVLSIALALAAPWLTRLLAGGFQHEHPELLALTADLIRLAAPLVWLLGMAGIFAAVLYAQRRFSFPSLATAVYNLGIVLAAPFLAPWVGVTALVIGLLAGGLLQVVLLLWDVRRSRVHLRLSLQWRHPALRKILLLYAPIAAGMVVALLQVGLDRRLASATGAQSIAWMANATTLQQLPLGLVSVAIALAALPQLSQQFAVGDEAAFRRTL
ncbi:MAG TPA: lipid II flippase MurJ, partial [Caldilineaceae bacterium]|nr:lipid II flippase MurJ [Caldilineaceae bacterium]